MKKLALYLFVLVLSFQFSSCKKDAEGPNYYLRFKANGQLINHNSNLEASFRELPDLPFYYFTRTYHEVVISGYNKKTSPYSSLEIKTVNPNPIEVTTYQTGGSEDKHPRLYLSLSVIKDSTTRISNHYWGKDISITFSEINDKYVRGTFSGSAHDFRDTIPLSEGEFCLPRFNIR